MILHAEWTKIRTLPGTPWLVLAIAAATLGAGLATAAVTPNPADPVRVSLTGVQLGQALVTILAVTGIGGEYASGMIIGTLAAMPRRTTVLAAKAVVLTGLILPAGTVAVPLSLLLSPLPAGSGALRAAIGSVLYLALIGLLALGIGTAVRNAAAATGVVLGLLFVVPLLIPALSDPDWQRHLQQIGPSTAGLAIQATTGLADLPISPWHGLLVLAGWAFSALLLGALLLARRDA